MKIIAICNQKGGVGKSTTTYHLARTFINQGKSVLVVDADPQGNITTALSADRLPDTATGLADTLSKHANEPITNVITSGIWENLDVVPTVGDNLGFVRDELLLTGAGREHRMKRALQPILGIYDYILIDCPPTLDLLLLNALTAAEGALVVSHPKQWSTDGLARLLHIIDEVKALYNPTLTNLGVVINHYEKATVSAQYWEEQVRQAATKLSFDVLQPYIPKRTLIADSVETHKGLDQIPRAVNLGLPELYTELADSVERKNNARK